MTTKYFDNQQAVIKFAVDETLASLREDHAAMMGTRASDFSDDEFHEVEDKIADLKAVGRSMGLRV
jgi:hypothetical protein